MHALVVLVLVVLVFERELTAAVPCDDLWEE